MIISQNIQLMIGDLPSISNTKVGPNPPLPWHLLPTTTHAFVLISVLGHSLTIMGLALSLTNEIHVIIFDPGMGGLKFKGFLKLGKTQKIIRNVHQFDRPDYQLIMVKDKVQIPEWDIDRFKKLQVTQKY